MTSYEYAPLRTIVAVLVGIALVLGLTIGLPVGLVTVGNVSHDHACGQLPSPGQRLACLTGGTAEVQAIRACDDAQNNSSNGISGTQFNSCIALATGKTFGASSASGSASASTATGQP